MCQINRNFKDNLYKNHDVMSAQRVYKGILENYLLIHTTGTIAVFKHKHHKQDVLVWNVIKQFDNGHSHFNNIQVAKMIANNVSLNRKPKQNMCLRNLASYPRIASHNYRYLEWVENLIETKIDKKLDNNNYHNVSRAI